LILFLKNLSAPWVQLFSQAIAWGRGNFAVYDEKALTLSQGEGRIGFEVSLWRNRPTDRRRTNLEKSRLALSAAEANAVQTRIEAVRTASQRYWDWVAAGKRSRSFGHFLR
jgi:hypothetical protein